MTKRGGQIRHTRTWSMFVDEPRGECYYGVTRPAIKTAARSINKSVPGAEAVAHASPYVGHYAITIHASSKAAMNRAISMAKADGLDVSRSY